MLSRKAEEAENIRLEWQKGKEIYNNEEAKFVLMLKATKLDLKTTEIKYHINEDEPLYNARLEIIKLESSYRKAECNIKALEEELRAAKMLARIQISEISNLEGGIK